MDLTEEQIQGKLAELAAARPDSVGLALPCAEIRVMDGQGHELAPGESGEILVRGPQVANGYHNRPRETLGWKSPYQAFQQFMQAIAQRQDATIH